MPSSVSPNSKSTRSTIVACLMMFISSFLISCGGSDNNTEQHSEELLSVASELNKNCPAMLDAETRLDSAVAKPNTTFAYYYTLVNYARGSIDTAKLRNALTPGMINNIKTSPAMKGLRDIDCTFLYIYRDKGGWNMLSILIKPEDYKN